MEEISIYQVFEGEESHLVAAFDEKQARGIAFGHRFADPDEWCDGVPTMRVEPVSDERAKQIIVGCDDDGSRTPAYLLLSGARIARAVTYIGGTLFALALLLSLTACVTLPDGRRVLTPEADAAARAMTLDVLACGSSLAIGEALAAITGGSRPTVDDYIASGECYADRLGARIGGLQESALAGTSEREALGRELAAAIEVEQRLGRMATTTTVEKASACEAKATGRDGEGGAER